MWCGAAWCFFKRCDVGVMRCDVDVPQHVPGPVLHHHPPAVRRRPHGAVVCPAGVAVWGLCCSQCPLPPHPHPYPVYPGALVVRWPAPCASELHPRVAPAAPLCEPACHLLRVCVCCCRAAVLQFDEVGFVFPPNPSVTYYDAHIAIDWSVCPPMVRRCFAASPLATPACVVCCGRVCVCDSVFCRRFARVFAAGCRTTMWPLWCCCCFLLPLLSHST